MRADIVALAAQIEILQEAHQRIAHDIGVYFSQRDRNESQPAGDTLQLHCADQVLESILNQTADALARTDAVTISSVEEERREWQLQNGTIRAKIDDIHQIIQAATRNGRTEREYLGRRIDENDEAIRDIKQLHLRNAEQIEAFVAEFNKRMIAVQAYLAEHDLIIRRYVKKKVKNGRPKNDGKKRRPGVKQAGSRNRRKKPS